MVTPMWVGPWWLPEPHLTIPVVEDVAECGTVVEDGAEYGNRATVNIIVIVQGVGGGNFRGLLRC